MSAHSGTLRQMANGRTKLLVKVGLTRGHNVSRNGCGPRVRIPLAPLAKAALTRGNVPGSGRFLVSVQHTCNLDAPTPGRPWRPGRSRAPTVPVGACRASRLRAATLPIMPMSARSDRRHIHHAGPRSRSTCSRNTHRDRRWPQQHRHPVLAGCPHRGVAGSGPQPPALPGPYLVTQPPADTPAVHTLEQQATTANCG
jgi:hypothetical protein